MATPDFLDNPPPPLNFVLPPFSSNNFQTPLIFINFQEVERPPPPSPFQTMFKGTLIQIRKSPYIFKFI